MSDKLFKLLAAFILTAVGFAIVIGTSGAIYQIGVWTEEYLGHFEVGIAVPLFLLSVAFMYRWLR